MQTCTMSMMVRYLMNLRKRKLLLTFFVSSRVHDHHTFRLVSQRCTISLPKSDKRNSVSTLRTANDDQTDFLVSEAHLIPRSSMARDAGAETRQLTWRSSVLSRASVIASGLLARAASHRMSLPGGKSVYKAHNRIRFNFSIDGHNMTIIEADGVETEPLTVDSLNIFAGEYLVNIPSQRLDTDLTALLAQRYSIVVSSTWHAVILRENFI